MSIRIQGSKGKSGGKSSAKSQDVLVAKKKALQTCPEHLLRLREALSTPDGRDRDLLKDCAAFATYARGGLDLRIEFFTGKTLSKEDYKACFKLSKDALMEATDACGLGWDDDEKRADLKDECARLLLARPAGGGPPTGFLGLRFSLQGELFGQATGQPVVYVSDVCVAPAARRLGLGRHLMTLAELIGARYQLAYVLTALPRGQLPGAEAFLFKGLKGYEFDALEELGPAGSGADEEPLAFVSKCIDRGLKAAKAAAKAAPAAAVQTPAVAAPPAAAATPPAASKPQFAFGSASASPAAPAPGGASPAEALAAAAAAAAASAAVLAATPVSAAVMKPAGGARASPPSVLDASPHAARAEGVRGDGGDSSEDEEEDDEGSSDGEWEEEGEEEEDGDDGPAAADDLLAGDVLQQLMDLFRERQGREATEEEVAMWAATLREAAEQGLDLSGEGEGDGAA